MPLPKVRIAVLAAFAAASLLGAAAPAMAQPGAPPAPANVVGSYRLGSGDRVRMITFGEASLTGEFVVSGSGTVALPLVGEVAAVGLTTTEFQQRVETALRDGYLREPRVSVEVVNYRPFYILGEVTKPGEYPYTNALTVLNAVATANGFTYRADTRHVFIKHAAEPGEHKLDLSSATVVAPGDTIRIGERLF